jgi:hypothetical protein
VRPTGELDALAVVGVEIAEDERTGMAVDDAGRRRGSAAIDPHRNAASPFVHRGTVDYLDVRRVGGQCGLASPPVQRIPHRSQDFGRQVGPCRGEVAQRGIEPAGGVGVGGAPGSRHVLAALCA